MNRNVTDIGFAIKTAGLRRRFGSLAAVDHIDLAIPHGEILGMLGGKGAGPL